MLYVTSSTTIVDARTVVTYKFCASMLNSRHPGIEPAAWFGTWKCNTAHLADAYQENIL
jgi:hypothetical protein